MIKLWIPNNRQSLKKAKRVRKKEVNLKVNQDQSLSQNLMIKNNLRNNTNPKRSLKRNLKNRWLKSKPKLKLRKKPRQSY